MLSYESGPARVFTRLRELLDFEHDDEGHPIGWPEYGLAEAVACPWCLGVWVVAACWALWNFGQDPGQAFLCLMAAATVLIAAHHVVMRLKDG